MGVTHPLIFLNFFFTSEMCILPMLFFDMLLWDVHTSVLIFIIARVLKCFETIKTINL